MKTIALKDGTIYKSMFKVNFNEYASGERVIIFIDSSNKRITIPCKDIDYID